MSVIGNKVLTIGHSTLPLETFLAMLDKAGVTAIADVRSSPFSARFPHFSRDEFRAALKDHGTKYVFLGKELGGRPRASNLYCDGVADYEKMALEPAFLKGIDRVINGAGPRRSGGNPRLCRRTKHQDRSAQVATAAGQLAQVLCRVLADFRVG